MHDDECGWLLVSVTTAGAPASLRVHVWRRLRGLGAVYLQQSVCLLPDRTGVSRNVRALLDRVQRDGGSGRALHIRVDDAAERQALVEQFRDASDAEYADLLGRIPGFLEELNTERAKGKTSYVEVEENEADLMRFRTWLSKIEARDYFGAQLRAEARTRLTACEEALDLFAADAFAVETAPGAEAAASATDEREPAAALRHLRSLEAVDSYPGPSVDPAAAAESSETNAALARGIDQQAPVQETR